MSKIEEDLRKEIDKWLPKVKREFEKIKDCKDQDFVKNIKAYIDDTQHFFDQGKLILSFESVIWAWAWLEIGQQKGILK